ncbi:hypothetical protein RB653_005390 [Dictyostelium firmibasis]|uniref:Uncharacterized protein n=1 Tax=Dictyostelium firmibasis TaxID=79012 RepID=A0AAN7Z431_9MYCE
MIFQALVIRNPLNQKNYGSKSSTFVSNEKLTFNQCLNSVSCLVCKDFEHEDFGTTCLIKGNGPRC